MIIRKHYSEAELAAIAQAFSMESWHKSDGTRHKLTAKERKIFCNIFYGALLTLNYGEAVRIVDSDKAQAICDCVEAQMRMFFPDYNWYVSVYTPLKRVLADWETEEKW